MMLRLTHRNDTLKRDFVVPTDWDGSRIGEIKRVYPPDVSPHAESVASALRGFFLVLAIVVAFLILAPLPLMILWGLYELALQQPLAALGLVSFVGWIAFIWTVQSR